MNRNKYWEDFKVGEQFISNGRQMTESDIRFLIGCAGGSHPLHTDPIFCAKRPDVGKPILQGSLVLGVVDEFFFESVCPGNEVLSMVNGYEKIRFIKPIYENDVLYTKFEIIETKEYDDEFGSLTCNATVYNQDDEVVTFAVQNYLVAKKFK